MLCHYHAIIYDDMYTYVVILYQKAFTLVENRLHCHIWSYDNFSR